MLGDDHGAGRDGDARTLRVISALSFSALSLFTRRRSDPDDGGPPARLSEIAITAQRAGVTEVEETVRELVAGFGDLPPERLARPSSELSPLHQVWSQMGRQVNVELLVLYDEDDVRHRIALGLLGGFVDRLPEMDQAPKDVLPDATIQVTAKSVGRVASQVVEGRHAPERLADCIADDLFPPPEQTRVAVNGSAGFSITKQTLAALAAISNVPLFVDADERARGGVVFLSLPPVAVDAGETLRRLDAVDDAVALGTEASPDVARSFARRQRVDELLVSEGTSPPPQLRASNLVRHLTRLADEARPLRGYPAGAELLERLAFDYDDAAELAGQLRKCVDSWIAQRLWSLNLVPEFVAHDDRHVERVDHLVTQLAGPLLRRGGLEPREFFWLSCAAWLHDWGHVSARLDGGFVTHAIHVRDLHGLLTQRLLERFPAMHELDADDAEKVGLLAAHHQSWTSFGDAKAKPKRAEIAQRYKATVTTLDDGAAAVRLDPSRARLLVALLRVADGADVGSHRVADLASRPDQLRQCAVRTLSRAVEELDRSDDPGKAELGKKLEELIDDIQRSHNPRWEYFHECADAVASVNDPQGEPLQGLPAAIQQREEDYLKLLSDQEGYYHRHDRVRRVRFRVSSDGAGGLSASAEVVPRRSSWASGTHGDPTADVDKDIRRELDRADAQGHSVGATLEGAGLHYAGACVVDW